jgi:hypothetical protein
MHRDSLEKNDKDIVLLHNPFVLVVSCTPFRNRRPDCYGHDRPPMMKSMLVEQLPDKRNRRRKSQ